MSRAIFGPRLGEFTRHFRGPQRQKAVCGRTTDPPVQEMVDDVGISCRQLSRDVHAAAGMTPKQYQNECRIERAKRLLEGTDLSITEIAMRLGYPSSQHFSAQFVKRVGMAPSAHRRTHMLESAP